MKIYIASSWKNQHAVEMLTSILRGNNHEVISWIENNYEENHAPDIKFDFEQWVNSDQSNMSFEFDTHGAATCDLFIYVGQAGKDAAAECGICYGQRFKGKTIPMLALWSKSEDFGLMRKMFDMWFSRHQDLINYIQQFLRD